MITITEPQERQTLLEPLQTLWEESVRATHDFLQESDIIALRPAVKEGLLAVPQFAVIWVDEQPAGFIGAAEEKVEMLFLHPAQRGHGLGRQLMQYAMSRWHCTQVDVNEQNPQAAGFYEHLGFEIVSRSPLDEQGNPFPILHLKLNK